MKKILSNTYSVPLDPFRREFHKIRGLYNTTRKHAFGNRFRDRKILVTIETDLETDILNVNLKKNQSLYRLLHNYRDRIRDQ